jgi:competence protein ComEA
MKQELKEYLSFSKRERRGIIILLSLIMLLVFFPQFLSLYNKHYKEEEDFSYLDAKIEAFLIQKKQFNDSLLASRNSFAPLAMDNQMPELFFFNPNIATEEDWQRLGLKPKLARTLYNYTSKGGRFYKKEGLKKIYGMDEETYDRISPYVLLEESKKEFHPKNNWETNNERAVKKPVLIEINSAEFDELLKIRGVGEGFAASIINYRKRIGGFLNKEQLLEVFGFDAEKLEEIEAQIMVDPEKVKKININTCTIGELARHPYMKRHIANSIVLIRDNHGPYKNTSEIQRSDLVNEELYRKLAPYLTIGESDGY